nr:hypothetical protein [Catenulispora rubra]
MTNQNAAPAERGRDDSAQRRSGGQGQGVAGGGDRDGLGQLRGWSQGGGDPGGRCHEQRGTSRRDDPRRHEDGQAGGECGNCVGGREKQRGGDQEPARWQHVGARDEWRTEYRVGQGEHRDQLADQGNCGVHVAGDLWQDAGDHVALSTDGEGAQREQVDPWVQHEFNGTTNVKPLDREVG